MRRRGLVHETGVDEITLTRPQEQILCHRGSLIRKLRQIDDMVHKIPGMAAGEGNFPGQVHFFDQRVKSLLIVLYVFVLGRHPEGSLELLGRKRPHVNLVPQARMKASSNKSFGLMLVLNIVS